MNSNQPPDWVVITVMLLYGASYAITVLCFHYHWQKEKFTGVISKYGWAGLNFTPVGWILYPTVRPWQRSEGAATRPDADPQSLATPPLLNFARCFGIALTIVTIVGIYVLGHY